MRGQVVHPRGIDRGPLKDIGSRRFGSGLGDYQFVVFSDDFDLATAIAFGEWKGELAVSEE
jgi:hypothetical protein